MWTQTGKDVSLAWYWIIMPPKAHTVRCTTVQEGLKIISWPSDRAQHFGPTSHLVEENGWSSVSTLWRRGRYQLASFRQLLCHRWETIWILWKVFLRTGWPKTGTLEHPPPVCKNLQKVYITLGLIRGCALGPLEASALGGKTPAPNGKVR